LNAIAIPEQQSWALYDKAIYLPGRGMAFIPTFLTSAISIIRYPILLLFIAG